MGVCVCVCDVIQSPLSPLPHTLCACFWHTALEELELTVTIHDTDAKDTLTNTRRTHTANTLNPMHITLTSEYILLFPFIWRLLQYCRKLLHLIQNKCKKPIKKPHIHSQIHGDKPNVPNQIKSLGLIM